MTGMTNREAPPQAEVSGGARIRPRPCAALESVGAEDQGGRRRLLAVRPNDRARRKVASRPRRRRPDILPGAGASVVQPAGRGPEGSGAAAPRQPRDVQGMVMATRRPKSMQRATVAAALQRDLDAIAKTNPGLATGTLAASAMSLARTMDSAATSAAGRSQCARALRELTDRLTAAAAPHTGESNSDTLDDLAARRDRRRAAAQTT